MKIIHYVIQKVLVVFLLTISLAGCDGDESSGLPQKGDYYPLAPGNQWEYVVMHKYHCNCPTTGFEIIDTVNVGVNEEILPSESRYTLLSDKDYVFQKMARKEGHQYFEFPPYRFEYSFLMDDKPVGYSWRDENFDVDLTVKQINGRLSVNGIQYVNVIEIEEMQQSPDLPGVYTETHRFFARDIGEIYSLKISNFGDGVTDTHELVLLKHTK
jgi:hypothetical protein